MFSVKFHQEMRTGGEIKFYKSSSIIRSIFALNINFRARNNEYSICSENIRLRNGWTVLDKTWNISPYLLT